MMKPMEKKRFRLLLEQAVAVSPDALIEASTASPTQLQPAAEVPAVALLKQEDERFQDGGTEAEDGILEGDANVDHVVVEGQIQGDAPGQDCGSEAEDGIIEGDASGEYEVLEGQVQGDDRGEFVEGDASGEHEDEEVPVQVQGSPGDVSEHEGGAFVIVRL